MVSLPLYTDVYSAQQNDHSYRTQTRRKSKKSAARLSKDGKWRSFPKAPRLLQHVSSGTYYARLHTGGKIIRQSCRVVYKKWTFVCEQKWKVSKDRNMEQDERFGFRIWGGVQFDTGDISLGS